MSELRDVAYGNDALQKMDLYVPDQPNHALIIYVHGGGWIRGDKHKDAEIGEQLAAAGYLVAIPNYRLSPVHRFPDAPNDLANACAWLKNSNYEFDRDRIGLFGASAGATMALMQNEAGHYPTVAWSPLLDFSSWLAEHTTIRAAVAATGPKPVVDAAFYKYVLQAYLGALDPDLLAQADPLVGLNQNLAPTLICNSQQELAPLSHALRFQGKAAGLGQSVTIQVMPGHHHARGYTELAMPNTIDFFNYHLLRS
ncbi:alpha/beta hydrolase [Lacticaseibacillus manihotivorans]|jgi:acetyl esterase/lipase|uniref:Esterase lipase n=3 Tax=Lacticaseibacillus manihotivorans TaxID=88233 RepID=A0A0R1PXQ6_9LACO|nr:alpha/beta hydrolase [Lacticaseibacillus manihotivorans]KRL37100.1 esterase lipase [Lacticaseibacillus manihotivorans DSM 13343 = JCM 12514]QFQ91824.1 alpha/beta hydrolase fold domain-containing protein [Lacticaseibacillus manihotivorans]